MSNLRLPYSFAPPPRWIFAYVRDRVISVDDGWLLTILFHLAKTDALASGGETPIALDTLLAYVQQKRLRRSTEVDRARDALRKRLERAEKRGLLAYRVSGNPTTGYVYLFRLQTEAPVVSALRPTSGDAPRPTSRDAEHGSGSAASPTGPPVASDLERAPSLHSCPTSDDLCPTSQPVATAVAERTDAPPEDEPCPTCRDVENYQHSVTRAGPHARTREDTPLGTPSFFTPIPDEDFELIPFGSETIDDEASQ